MTANDNNRLLAICYLVYGGLIALGGMAMFALPLVAWANATTKSNEAAAYSGAMFAVGFGLFFLVLGAIPLVTAIGMLQRRSWARIAGIISAFLFIWNFPLGMALGIFTLIFMFSERGRQFYLAA
jgi:hypothetical protein